MAVYRSQYFQRGYGIGGIFRGIAKKFRPVARNVVKVINKPEVQRVLKTIGKETVDAGNEMLIEKLKGNDVKPKLSKRISNAKKRIAESIERGIRKSKKRKYQRFYNEISGTSSEEDDLHFRPTRHSSRLVLKNRRKPTRQFATSQKKKPNNQRSKNSKSKQSQLYRTVFD